MNMLFLEIVSKGVMKGVSQEGVFPYKVEKDYHIGVG